MNHDTPDGLSLPEPHDEWVIAAKSHSADLLDCSLVLSAVGIDHQIDRHAGVIFVRRSSGSRAMSEVQAFREENRDWPPPSERPQPFVRNSGWPSLLMIIGLILIHAASGPWASESTWFQDGAVSSEAILKQGQWWRLVTALTLHADQGHLMGNCLIGGLMAHLLCKTLGSGTAWLAMILSASFANFLNIALRGAPHYSVGFSTAVFAAIGIFCGRQLPGGASSLARRLLLPLGAGAGLLAMLGSSNEGGQTDLGAHLFGLLCGLACGLLLRISGIDRLSRRRGLQNILFSAALALTAACWLLAAA